MMDMHKRTASAGIVACMTGVLLLFIVVFSSFFIAVEAVHECTGEECPICESIERCESALRKICTGIVSLISIVLPAILFILPVVIFAYRILQKTPVSFKVRLND